MAATLLILEKLFIMANTRTHSNTSHTKANKYQPKLKKNVDHKKFTSSWYVYNFSACNIASLFAPEVSTRYDDIPIKIYKTVHTTGNSHPGGANGGLFSRANCSILPRVNSADTAPTSNGMAIHFSNKLLSIFMVSYLF